MLGHAHHKVVGMTHENQKTMTNKFVGSAFNKYIHRGFSLVTLVFIIYIREGVLVNLNIINYLNGCLSHLNSIK